MKQKKITKNKTNVTYTCGGCQEIYKDEEEAWIECSMCKTWWHEICTACIGVGEFICDLCID